MAVRRRAWGAVAAVVALLALVILIVQLASEGGGDGEAAEPAPGPARFAEDSRRRQEAGEAPLPVQLTFEPEIELDPAFSPDGESLAYSSDRTGSFEIYVKRSSPGGDKRQLTDDGMENFQPAWSPDGRRIAYHSEQRDGIWVMPARGGDSRRVTEFGSQPAWSPDGTWIVFQSDAYPQVDANALPALPGSVLWKVSSKGGEPTALTEAGDPSGGHATPKWSPDGRRLVFTSHDRLGSSAWILDPASGALEEVGSSFQRVFDPEFSPDGRALLLSGISEAEEAPRGLTYGLWRLPLDPGGGVGTPEPVSGPVPDVVRQISIGPRGRRLAYSAMLIRSNLWSLRLSPENREPTEVQPLTTGNGRNNRPDISPDGKTVVFEHWLQGETSDIWAMDLFDLKPRRLTFRPESEARARFFPDGESIVFSAPAGEGVALWKLALEDGQPRRFFPLPADADWFDLSRDGDRVAYHSRRGSGAINTWVGEVGSGTSRQITFDDELAGFPVWSPEGDRLAIEVRRRDTTQIAVISSEGTWLGQVTSKRGHSWPYGWSPDGEWISFAGFRDGVWNIYRVHVESGEEQALTRFDDRHGYVRYPAWSPRGDRIVFERADTVGDLWMVTLEEADG